jgi:hypothetical protein
MGGFNRDIGVSWDRDRPAMAKLCEASQPLKQKAGYKVSGSLLIAFFFLWDFAS